MKNTFVLLSALLTLGFSAGAQSVAKQATQTYEISAPAKSKTIYEGRLKMGGTNSQGESIAVNSFYMSMNGKPVIPVMGEFHYSRYPEAQWEEEIIKMKAGGINVLPSYIFWSLHEPHEGQFVWTGNRNLRHFVELCQKHNMKVIVRIGPFGHGEIRNGALPDWLFTKNLEVRSNDPLYLEYTRKLYIEIGKQLTGLYFKEGGPIIGCQLENEMQHAAAPWGICYPGEPADYTSATADKETTMIGVGVQEAKLQNMEKGNEHMRILKRLATEAGIVVPFYTATAWGNAAVLDNEAIPVTSAYTYPTWSKPAMSPFCLFKDIQRNPDYAPIRYDGEQFPSFAAEMGVGIQMTYDSRPNISAQAANALMIRCLGSGSNGIGYYMYHGGSTPMREDQIGFWSDEPMGVPKINYDFQAPLGEFGLENRSYRYLRELHSFLADFGDRLAPMETVLPAGYDKITPANQKDLRYAARMKEGKGFLFLINFQDHDTTRVDQQGLQLKLNLEKETLLIPEKGSFTLPKDESLILPFNFSMEDALLKYAMAQPLMKIDDQGVEHYFFFAPEGLTPEFVFDKATVRGKNVFRPVAGLKSTFKVTTKGGKHLRITTLTNEQALNASKVNGKLLITQTQVVPTAEEITLLSFGNPVFNYVLYPSKFGFKEQTGQVEPVEPQYTIHKVGTRRMAVNYKPQPMPQVQEYFLDIRYVGDVAMAFIDNHLAHDHFYYGEPWRMGLKRYYNLLQSQPMTFYFRPMQPKAPYLGQLPLWAVPDLSKGPVLEVKQVKVVPQYRMKIE